MIDIAVVYTRQLTLLAINTLSTVFFLLFQVKDFLISHKRTSAATVVIHLTDVELLNQIGFEPPMLPLKEHKNWTKDNLTLSGKSKDFKTISTITRTIRLIVPEDSFKFLMTYKTFTGTKQESQTRVYLSYHHIARMSVDLLLFVQLLESNSLLHKNDYLSMLSLLFFFICCLFRR